MPTSIDIIAILTRWPLNFVRISMPPGEWTNNGFFELIKSNEKPPAMEMEGRPASISEAQFDHYNTFVNYFIHQINLMRHLMGEPYRVTHADKHLLVCESESGIIGSLEMNTHRTASTWEESAKVCFEHAYIDLQLPSPLALNRAGRVSMYVDIKQGEGTRIEPTMPWKHAMLQQAEDFVAVCRGEKQPPTDGEEAVRDLINAEQYITMLGQRK